MRLLVHVEGETEETFVNRILAPHLYALGFQQIGARLLGNARQRDRRGGIRPWISVRKDILNHLKEDDESLTTTLVDYYALPQHGDRAWPGRGVATGLPFAQKAEAVESALLADIRASAGSAGDRFVPFVMMHEFEALLFSDPDRFAAGIGRPDLAPKFRAVREQFGSPEEINDSSDKAPSKRIESIVPGYQKPLFGLLGVQAVGLDAIRRECPHFHTWVEQLEQRIGK